MSSSDNNPIFVEPGPPRAVYIHVPFCAHRCGYCDFTLIARRDDLIGDYLKSLAMEMERKPLEQRPLIDTLFFGGGTPTHLSADQFTYLFQIVNRHFQCSPNAEVSVEANPLDLTDEKIERLSELGVNRISLGVQSFSQHALETLERDHRAESIRNVVQRLRPRFRNFSFDLIFGVPGQSLQSWRETLEQAIELEPAHLSTYGLTFERGTAFWTRRERGEMANIPEDLERDEYALAMEFLQAAGYQQYEISNFARPGFECRHNHVYWSGDEYWAFGPGAARYIHGRRETNIRSVLSWLAKIESGQSPVADEEELSAEHRARELVYLGLRRNRGVSRQEFFERTGYDLGHLYHEQIEEQSSLGFLESDDAGIRLTSEGRFIADRVVMEFL